MDRRTTSAGEDTSDRAPISLPAPGRRFGVELNGLDTIHESEAILGALR